jgi:hypothetical protein
MLTQVKRLLLVEGQKGVVARRYTYSSSYSTLFRRRNYTMHFAFPVVSIFHRFEACPAALVSLWLRWIEEIKAPGLSQSFPSFVVYIFPV